MTDRDRTILRELARRVAEIGALPTMDQRRKEWKRHNSMKPGRAMVLVFPEGSWGEILPWSVLECEDEGARHMEWDLRHRIHMFEHFDTDNVVDGEWLVGKVVHNSGWGIEARRHPSTTERGSWKFDPVIHTPADLAGIHPPELRYDEAATLRNLDEAQDLFGDILEVRLVGAAHISFHLMNIYTSWRGLEQVMTDMASEPNWVHEAMSILEEGHHKLVRQYQELGLLSLNNNNTYHSTGANGWTDELPAPGFDPDHVRPCDMWCSAETQEFAQVSPRMHAEFALQYEKRLLAPFGLNGYGCCEPLDHKLADVLAIPNIRRVSIAPMANVATCARQMGRKAIFNWKPDPSMLIGRFDEATVRAYIRKAMADAEGCQFEMALKDTHTCENHPERFDAWCRVARECVEEAG